MVSIENVDASTAALGLGSSGVGTIEEASEAARRIDVALKTVSGHRASRSASIGRLETAHADVVKAILSLSAAESRLRDVGTVFEVSSLTREMIVQQAALAIQAQANAQPHQLLALLEGDVTGGHAPSPPSEPTRMGGDPMAGSEPAA